MRAEVVFGKVTNEELDALVDDPGARLYTYEVREGTEVGDFVMCSNGAPGTVVRHGPGRLLLFVQGDSRRVPRRGSRLL